MTFLRSTPANRCNSAPDSPCGRSSSKRERYLRISVAWGSSESASGDTSKWISSGLPTIRSEYALETALNCKLHSQSSPGRRANANIPEVRSRPTVLQADRAGENGIHREVGGFNSVEPVLAPISLNQDPRFVPLPKWFCGALEDRSNAVLRPALLPIVYTWRLSDCFSSTMHWIAWKRRMRSPRLRR
jgi:hypothetical protein